jgi:glutamyl-tRNA synthetase
MVRVRFAPSPTGNLHIGSLRTAIFNWLFARHNNGKFLIRIEDTDTARSKREYVDSILDSLKWMGIEGDELIVFQSQRFEEYKKIIEKLLEEGKAYRCYCTQEEVKQRCSEKGLEYCKYDGLCRSLKEVRDKPFVVRFKLPEDKRTVEFEDIIRGKVTVGIDQLDDFIIARSDGSPMYNFVVIVDDAQMKISHVIRGEDHISNTPKQILLYEACGYSVPKFAHIPLILAEDGSKLSKRHASVSALDYKNNGFLSDALFNYLVRLGWSHGDQEIFTREELIKDFTLKAVGKKGAIFDIEKLKWLNGVYIRKKSAKEVYDLIINNIDPDFRDRFKNWSDEQILKLIDLYKERAKTLLEIEEEIDFLYCPAKDFDEEIIEEWIEEDDEDEDDEEEDEEEEEVLSQFVKTIETIGNFNSKNLLDIAKNICKEKNIKLGKLAQPLRFAITGKTFSPGVFELMDVLGKEESLKRLKKLYK